MSGTGTKVVYHTTMSLDGFIADDADELGWMVEYGGTPNPAADAAIDSFGAVLSGRRTHDVNAGSGGSLYGGAWSGQEFVLTHHRPETGDEERRTFLSVPLPEAVDRARAAAGDKDVVLIGADLAGQCLREGLCDEILVHVVPVLLGRGVPFYGAVAGADRIRLRRTELSAAGQVTNLRFEVLGPADR